ncbi:DUF3141 domain-containing protein [Sinorhizobium alkalisoli]|uniref:Uncharacterized protein n=1 Tax=Sinorhizobium alkalisoli TaxID=1752398 RepID=A0A1E3VCA6_9HYPH|nr:DUF3141 domain-containing protein [Sinorhizobium alkalisoli]ODR91218.1 hypothetical protein A8M32_10395 [Sinorhizobium alkalisoli]QFI70432.1 hypothetical protein EKH55_5558 [Sinorhizobium alkalisoli]
MLGKRIIYLLNDEVGHLGIFISSDVMSKEYHEVVTTLDAIELLAPGIYELCIKNFKEVGTNELYSVEIAERSFDDIRVLCDNFDCESAFTAVSRVSEFQAQLYQMLARPFVKMAVTNFGAELGRAMHPLRLSRTLTSSNNPFTGSVEYAAKQVRACRHKASEDNPFLAVEAAWVLSVRSTLEFWRECRDMSSEMLFLTLWNTPWVCYIEHFRKWNEESTLVDDRQQVSGSITALSDSKAGGFVEAVIRMLVLLVKDRHSVRRDRLRRWLDVLKIEPFKSLDAERLQTIIRQQASIASDEVEHAIQTLPILLPECEKRRLAYRLVCHIIGPAKEMLPGTRALLQQFAEVLGQPCAEGDVAENPLSIVPDQRP